MPRGIPDAMRVDTQDTGRMSEVEPQDSNNPDNQSIQSPGTVVGGVVLLAISLSSRGGDPQWRSKIRQHSARPGMTA